MSDPEIGRQAKERVQKKAELYDARRALVLNLGDSEGRLAIDAILEPRIRLVAAFSLIQEGIIGLGPELDESIELTDDGLRRYNGFKALSRG